MAGETINKDDILGGLPGELVKLISLIGDSKKELESLIISQQKLAESFRGGSSKELKDLYKSMQVLNKAIEQHKKLTETEIIAKQKLNKIETENAKLEKEKINRDIQNEKLKQQKNKTTQTEIDLQKKKNKEAEQAVKDAAKEAEQLKKLNSAYSIASSRLNDLRKSYRDLAIEEKHNTNEGRNLLKQITELDTKLKDVDASVGQFQRNVGNYTSAFDALPGALGRVVQGAKELGTEFFKLLKNPIVLTITLITTALFGLFKAFTSTDSGSVAFQARMEQVSAILDVLRVRAVSLIDALVNVFKGNWTEAAANFKTATTGITDALNEAANAASEYIKVLDELEDRENNYISNAAENANKIAKLEFMAADKTKSAKIRRDALKEAIKLSEEESRQQIEFANDRLNIEADYLAKKAGLDKSQVISFIQLSDEGQANSSKELKALRNNNEDKFKELEEFYGKKVDADTKFYEDNKRNISKLSALEEEFKDAELKRQKSLSSQFNASQEERIKQKEFEIELNQVDIDEQKTRSEKTQAELLTGYNAFNLKKIKIKKDTDKQISILEQEQFKEQKQLLADKRLLDLQKAEQEITDINLQNEKKLQIEADYTREVTKLENKNQKEVKKRNDQQIEDAKKVRNQRIKVAAEEASNILEIFNDQIVKSNEARQKGFDDQIASREKSVDRQQELAERGANNTLVFEQEQLAKEKLIKAEEEKREQSQQENIAFLKLLSGYAEKDPNTAVTKAIRDIGLAKAARILFAATGAENIKGPGTKTSDSIDARLSVGESVLTADATEEWSGFPTAANQGWGEKWLMENWLGKSIATNEIKGQSFASNVSNSLQLNQLVNMNKKLESLEATIKAKKETEFHLNNLGEVIKIETEKGIRRSTTFKRPRI